MTDEPRLRQNSQTVTLSFEGTLIQSCMRLDDPEDLVLDYTRTMMGALLFHPKPAKVLMIGLGDAFHIPPDDARLHTLCADGAKFIAKPPHAYDLILVDGFTGTGIAEALCSRSFYNHCRKALTPEGFLVANVQADTNETREIGRRLFKAFSGAMISVLSDEGGNDIVTAGPRHLFEQCRADFDAHWAALGPAHQATLAVASQRIQRALIKGFPIG